MASADRKRISIRTLISLAIVTPIVLLAILLVALSWKSNEQIAQQLGNDLMLAAAQSVRAQVWNYLTDAVRLSDRYTRRLESGVIPDRPLTTWQRPMFDDLLTTPSVASICYGNGQNDATWMLRGDGRIELGLSDGSANGRAVESVIDKASGNVVGEPIRVYNYDPSARPWWKAALASPNPVWTPVYSWYAGNTAVHTIGTGYTRQLRQADGSLRGVLVIDVTLGALSDFLKELRLAKLGHVYIVDAEGKLVAASHGPVTDEKGECYRLSNSPEPTAKHVGQAFEKSRGLEALDSNARLLVDGTPIQVAQTHLTPYPGIDWRLIAAVPESAFLAKAQAARRDAAGIGLIGAVVALLLALLISRYLSSPVIKMTEHVKRVSAGDFDARVHLETAQELAVLSKEINSMAAGLKQRMQLEHALAVAMEVQQCLLPMADPTLKKLDVAGRSKYCDQTGGDYFDFIDVSPLNGSSLLLAVGDVMGHGIAAALLMASARASVRTSALDRPSLASLMSRTNAVLAENNRHNRFMTLSLMRIDGDNRTVRYACAGHDPAIVYIPVNQEFQSLEGGDVPLGVAENIAYVEYTGGPFPSGSVLVMGTDGIWETFNEKQEPYGKERLSEMIKTHADKPAHDIASAIETDLARFRGANSIFDDVTFVIVKFV